MITFIEYLLEQDDPCWKKYRQLGTKKKDGEEVPNCIPIKPIKEEKDTKEEANYQDKPKNGQYCEDCTMWREPNKCTAVEGVISPEGWCSYFEEKEEDELEEATYQGRDVPLNKPMKGDVKKSKVFVDPDGDGKATKVNFGDKNMTIKKHIASRRKSFRARHNCDNPGPKDKARYWSCKAW